MRVWCVSVNTTDDTMDIWTEHTGKAISIGSPINGSELAENNNENENENNNNNNANENESETGTETPNGYQSYNCGEPITELTCAYKRTYWHYLERAFIIVWDADLTDVIRQIFDAGEVEEDGSFRAWKAKQEQRERDREGEEKSRDGDGDDDGDGDANKMNVSLRECMEERRRHQEHRQLLLQPPTVTISNNSSHHHEMNEISISNSNSDGGSDSEPNMIALHIHRKKGSSIHFPLECASKRELVEYVGGDEEEEVDEDEDDGNRKNGKGYYLFAIICVGKFQSYRDEPHHFWYKLLMRRRNGDNGSGNGSGNGSECEWIKYEDADVSRFNLAENVSEIYRDWCMLWYHQNQ